MECGLCEGRGRLADAVCWDCKGKGVVAAVPVCLCGTPAVPVAGGFEDGCACAESDRAAA
jgi:DnaJ-class molecular chaperone